MEIDEFKTEFKAMASAMNKRLEVLDDTVAVYYRTFRAMPLRDWQALCQKAIEQCEKFPVVATLKRIAAETNLTPAQHQPYHRAHRDPWIIVLCRCGQSFAVRRSVIERDSTPSHCPGQAWQPCPNAYDSAEILAGEIEGTYDPASPRHRQAQPTLPYPEAGDADEPPF